MVVDGYLNFHDRYVLGFATFAGPVAVFKCVFFVFVEDDIVWTWVGGAGWFAEDTGGFDSGIEATIEGFVFAQEGLKHDGLCEGGACFVMGMFEKYAVIVGDGVCAPLEVGVYPGFECEESRFVEVAVATLT